MAMALAGYELVAAITLFVGLASPVAVRVWRRDPLDPGILFLVLLGLYAWSSAANVVWVGQGEFGTSVLRTFYVTVLAGEIGFLLAYVAAPRTPKVERLVGRLAAVPVAQIIIWSGLLALAGYLLLALFGGLPSLSAIAYTDWALESRLTERASDFGGVSTVLHSLPNGLMLICLLLTMLHERTKAVIRIAAGGVLLLALAHTVRSGGKFEVLFVAFLVLCHLNYAKGALKFRYLVIAAVLLYPLATMITHVRNTTSLTMMVSEASDLIQRDPSILSPDRSSELVGPPRSLMLIIEDIGRGSMSYSFGATYVDELATWIPRAIWPDRPRPMAEQFMERFFPRIDAQGGGKGFFVLTGGYWALGIIGAVAEAAACGWLLGWLYALFAVGRRTLIGNLLYGVLAFWFSVMVIRTGLVGVTKAALMAAAPLLLLAAVAWGIRRALRVNTRRTRFTMRHTVGYRA
jgi:hypothetical protein